MTQTIDDDDNPGDACDESEADPSDEQHLEMETDPSGEQHLEIDARGGRKINRRHSDRSNDGSRDSGGDGDDHRRTYLEILLPASRWIRTYDFWEDFPHDFIAGVTVGVMSITIAMSDALIAGLPVEYGLYASVVPVIVYALFGDCAELVVGPTGMTSIVMRSGLWEVAKEYGLNVGAGDGSGEGGGETVEGASFSAKEGFKAYEIAAIQCGFLVGIIYVALGLLRTGTFISRILQPVIVSGFTTGAVAIIMMSQLGSFLGYYLGNIMTVPAMAKKAIESRAEFDYRDFSVGILSFSFLILITTLASEDRFRRESDTAQDQVARKLRLQIVRNMAPIIVSMCMITLSHFARFDEIGIATVGHIPSGLPNLTIDVMAGPYIGGWRLVTTAFAVAAMGLYKSLALAKNLAELKGRSLDSNAELVGLGISNVFGSFFQSSPVVGTISRSGANVSSGARTGVSAALSAVVVLLALILGSAIFEPMPYACLAAIVDSLMLGMIDIREPINQWYRGRRFKSAVWVVCASGTAILGVELGLAICLFFGLADEFWSRCCVRSGDRQHLPEVDRGVETPKQAHNFSETESTLI